MQTVDIPRRLDSLDMLWIGNQDDIYHMRDPYPQRMEERSDDAEHVLAGPEEEDASIPILG